MCRNIRIASAKIKDKSPPLDLEVVEQLCSYRGNLNSVTINKQFA